MTNRTGVKDKRMVYQMGKICLRKRKPFRTSIDYFKITANDKLN